MTANIKEALAELAAAVHDLCDPIQGNVLRDDLKATEHTGPSLLDQISRVGHGGDTGKSRGAPNRLPLDPTKLAALLEIQADATDLHDRAVMHSRLTAEEQIRRIHELAQSWSDPQAVLWVRDHVRSWQRMISSVLDPERRLSIAAACPQCQARMVMVEQDGSPDRVQVDAIRVDMVDGKPAGATCQACGVSWAPQQFEFLGRLLGCSPIEEAS